MIKYCPQCNKKIVKRKDEWLYLFKARKYCNHKCSLDFKKGKHLAGTFKKGSKINVGRVRLDMRGKNNINWKGGVTPQVLKDRKSFKNVEWRRKWLKRDNYTCQKCGERGGYLNVHHISNFSSDKNNRGEIKNGIVLCRLHHRLFHKIYGVKNNNAKQLKDFISTNITLTFGVFDMLHFGHLKLLNIAKTLNDNLYIGLYTDEVAKSFKRKPIMTYKERYKLLKEIGFNVIKLTRLDPNRLVKRLEKKYKTNVLVAKATGATYEKYYKDRNRYILLNYTEGISTSDIIKRICSRKH